MRLVDVIQGRLVIPRLRARTKWDAIEELIDRLVDEREIRILDRPEVLDAVRTREVSLSTGIGAQVALPHARTGLVDDLIGTLGVSLPGIPFDASDGKPAHVLCLLLIPNDQYSDHMQTLSHLARLLSQPGIRGELMQASRSGSADDVVRVLEAHEGPDYLRG